MQSKYIEILMGVLTIFVLYADDVRVLAANKDQDNGFYIAQFVCLIFFLLEFVVFCVFKENYNLSFNFFMDCISTISLIFDIPWLTQALFNMQFNGSEV